MNKSLSRTMQNKLYDIALKNGDLASYQATKEKNNDLHSFVALK